MKCTIALLLAFLAAPAFAAPSPPTVDPNKPVTVTLPAQDWVVIVNSIDSKRITQAIIQQAQPQIAPASPPAKK